jgi:hypothetical protein
VLPLQDLVDLSFCQQNWQEIGPHSCLKCREAHKNLSLTDPEDYSASITSLRTLGALFPLQQAK